MFYKNKLKNYAAGGDERSVELTGKSAIITLIAGVGIFLLEMFVKLMITKDLRTISWEAVLLLVMIILFATIHFLNKIPMKKE